MQTKKNIYNNGKIYRVCDNGYTKFYYGSTVQPLAVRMGGHRLDYTRCKNCNFQQVSLFDIFDEFNHSNCKIELVELYPCQSREELRKREGYHIQNNECVNKRVAGRSGKEYREQNREAIHEKQKEYYNKHIEKIRMYRKGRADEMSNYNKEYRKQNLEALKEYQAKYRNEHKDAGRVYQAHYHAKHREQMIQYYREYRKKKKECIPKPPYEGLICSVCHTPYTKQNKARHEKTQKHQEALKQQEPETEP